MSAVHLERWNNLCRQKRTTFGTSANRKEQPFAGGTPPRTPPDSIFCIACKQQPGADQFTEGCGLFCTNFRIPEWAPPMDEVPAKEVTKNFGTNFGLIGTCRDRGSYSCKQHWTCNLSAFGSEKFAWYDLSAFASQKCLQKSTGRNQNPLLPPCSCQANTHHHHHQPAGGR